MRAAPVVRVQVAVGGVLVTLAHTGAVTLLIQGWRPTGLRLRELLRFRRIP